MNKGRGSAAHASSYPDEKDLASAIQNATKQLESLLRSVPGGSNMGHDTDEEIDQGFAGMITCNHVNMSENIWVIDSGASDHMSTSLKGMKHVRVLKNKLKITLPNGQTTLVTHMGSIYLRNGVKLCNVLVVPAFNQNLLSVQKLVRDNHCVVTFFKENCVIQDHKTMETKELGKALNGLYYFDNKDEEKESTIPRDSTFVNPKTCNSCDVSCKTLKTNCYLGSIIATNALSNLNVKSANYFVWHKRPGHLPTAKLQLVSDIFNNVKSVGNHPLCLACPMAKLTKFPFPNRTTKSLKPFELIHMDIWGPYGVPYKGHYRYFLTIVDDYSRATWVYLLKFKSDAF
ncbi:hypothetical protein RND81_10G056600 [Saponaria officinalis]|uniref:Retrovirus-related Pol polyprotein from transposon TNT 1-94-like beta-barrel domain-containing protein n=1 Tax=Saponaria officinalis TaxID=3572 RepID=A0AAW1I172_SAPOF